jgi:glycosyltransferase involved in cell wall biosynthesis
MPVYNGERFLRPAIESVLGQTYSHFEFVLVDDGSTDGSWSIAEEYARRDPRVRPFRNERNLGIVKTRNRAFAEASQDAVYFAVLDCDDVSLPDRLKRQVAFLQAHPDHALVGGNTLIIDEHDNEIGRRIYPSSHERIAGAITRYNPIAQPTVMIRRSALEQVGVYDDRYPRCQDYDLWLRMAARFKIANLDAFTLKYRISASQGKRTQLRASLKHTIEIQRRWLFHPSFFRPQNVLYWCAEHALLAMPEAWVLSAFKRITYH